MLAQYPPQQQPRPDGPAHEDQQSSALVHDSRVGGSRPREPAATRGRGDDNRSRVGPASQDQQQSSSLQRRQRLQRYVRELEEEVDAEEAAEWRQQQFRTVDDVKKFATNSKSLSVAERVALCSLCSAGAIPTYAQFLESLSPEDRKLHRASRKKQHVCCSLCVFCANRKSISSPTVRSMILLFFFLFFLLFFFIFKKCKKKERGEGRKEEERRRRRRRRRREKRRRRRGS